MKIKNVRLQNIKSYSDETIFFNDGVNFISGVNGAGKTTLIESIGYGLFDRKPGIIKEFIRYGSGTGTITIEFEANDERLYRVVRKCGNVNSWVVFDVESDSELDLHSAADVKPWLKEIMGIDREQDLSQLFEDIIGVGQGTFTAPFLDTPAGRRDKFNKMLKVEVYREAHGKTKSTVRFIEEKMQEAKLQIAKLQGSVSEYDSIKEKRENLKPVIEMLSKELLEKKALRDKKAKIREELRGLSTDIQKFKNNINIQEITLENLKENENKLNGDLSASQHSCDILNKSKAGFSAYKDAQKKLEGLEKRRTVRDTLVNALTKTKQSIGELSAGINSGNENVKAQETEVNQKINEYITAQEQQENDARIYLEKFNEIRVLEEKFNNSEPLLDKFENYKKRFDLQNTKCDSVFVRWEELSTSERNLLEKLSQESELVAEMQKIKALESKRDQLLQKTAAVESEIKTLESNRQKTLGGNCPFLDAPCKNVGGDGDLNKFFFEEIKKRNSIKAEYCLELEEIEKLIAQGGPIRIKLGEIEGAKVSLKGIEEEKKKHENILSEYRENIKKYFTLGIVSDLHSAFTEHLSDMAVLVPENDNCEMLEKLNEMRKSFTGSWYNFEALYLKDDISDISLYKNLIGDFTIVLDRVGEILKQFKSAYRRLTQAISKEKALRNGECAKANEAIENTKKNIWDLQERQKKISGLKTRLKEMVDRLNKLNIEREKFEKNLEQYKELDLHINTEKGIIDINQEFYDTYMQNYSEAQKLDKIKIALESIRSSIKKTNEEKLKITEKLIEISKEFSQEKLIEAEKQFDNINEQLVSGQNYLTERMNDLSEMEAKLSKMDKIKIEIEKLEALFTRYSKLREMLEFTRSLLNKVGERVSAVFRNYLAVEANRIYHEISNENVTLDWKDDYEVTLVDNFEGRERERCFRQLSGGEQMTAALAMRLGFLQQLTNLGLGFFDEPTTNLDSERRSNLAQVLPGITKNFDQLFVISHDDSFDSMTENVVQLSKDAGEGTKIAD